MSFNDLIKKLDKDLMVTETKIDNNILYIYCQSEKNEASCSYCNEISSSVHSTYTRTIKDLSIQQYEVKLVVTVNKYFCNNEKCEHKTFAEKFDFVKEKAVRTKRLDEYIERIGVRNSSMDTVRDLKDNFINVSLNTVLRIIHKKKD